jgi:hypothetical protein
MALPKAWPITRFRAEIACKSDVFAGSEDRKHLIAKMLRNIADEVEAGKQSGLVFNEAHHTCGNWKSLVWQGPEK